VPPSSSHNTLPECFGDLEKVFPQDGEGMREVPAGCWDCGQRTDCLRAAAGQKDGKKELDEERALRSDPDGVAGFLKRWSRRKDAARREES
jgi:hypothetical protein